jgi:OPA family sugar phosphate sensor protein UhpC-like MFS transporter
MFVAYGVLYFCRKNISAALPVMSKDLGYSNLELGILGSTLYITYGIGKFMNGIVADRANVRTFMASGLILSGLANLWFGSLTSLWGLAFAWGLNGWVQSMGFPPIAKGLTVWYEAKGKATRWAIWTCSHQAGTAAILAITGVILARTGNDWRLCFTPESKGLPKVHYFDATSPEYRAEKEADYWKIFIKRVLLNRQLWVIAMVNLCVYIIRYGTLDWATKFLIERKGYEAANAAGMAATMPLFGIGGVLLSGFVSDRVFKGSFRAVNIIMLSCLTVAMILFYRSGNGVWAVDFALLAAIGFCVEGPQSILGGIASVDVGGSPRIASSAAGLVGVCGYFGATLSSLGTGFTLDRYGWGGGFVFWTACSIIGLALCLFSWRTPASRAAAVSAPAASDTP